MLIIILKKSAKVVSEQHLKIVIFLLTSVLRLRIHSACNYIAKICNIIHMQNSTKKTLFCN